jgi:hypothetical protein
MSLEQRARSALSRDSRRRRGRRHDKRRVDCRRTGIYRGRCILRCRQCGADAWGAATGEDEGDEPALAVSLPLIDVGEPLVDSLVTVMAFGERPGSLTVAMSRGLALTGGIIAGGVVLLGHSPAVQAAQPRRVPPAAAEGGPSRVGRTHKDGYRSPACNCEPFSHARDVQHLVPDGHSPTTFNM